MKEVKTELGKTTKAIEEFTNTLKEFSKATEDCIKNLDKLSEVKDE